MTIRFLGTGVLLGLLAAACATQSDATTSDDELNENKALGMTDVTILYPLPQNMDFFDDMLGPSSEDAQGELMPAALYEELVKLDAPPMMKQDGSMDPATKKVFEPWLDDFARLRVVGIRLDPCFGESLDLGNAECTNTIRLTAQFFNTEQGSARIDGRAAIHLFYKVSRADFTAIAQRMLELRKTSGLPLQKGLFAAQNRGIHPSLLKDGLRGEYALALKELVLKYAGERTLSRIAFAIEDRNLTAGGGYYQGQGQLGNNRWVFGGFEYRSARFQPLTIATLNGYAGQQTVDTVPFLQGTRTAQVVVTPALVVPDNFLQIFNPVREANGQVDPAAQEKARQATVILQNPMKYTTKNSDCTSCHMAKQAAPNFTATPNFTSPSLFKSATYRLDHSDDRVGPFRHFGYDVNGNPVVSSRVVNETVVVLDYLNKNIAFR